MTCHLPAAVRGGCGVGVSVVGRLVGWAPRSSLEMRLIASRAAARALFVLTANAEARCRLIHPAMSIVVTMPRMIMETSSSMSVMPA